MEIEKKFLVNAIPFDLSDFEKSEILQTYISFSPVIRLRKSNNIFYLTCKGKGRLSREEFEIKITEEEYLHLLTKSDGQTIKKTRYYIPIENSFTAELDIYHNDSLNNLITVEVEFSNIEEAENFVPPNWFAKDVTFESKYSNSALAQIL